MLTLPFKDLPSQEITGTSLSHLRLDAVEVVILDVVLLLSSKMHSIVSCNARDLYPLFYLFASV